MRRQIKEYIRKCPTWQKNKTYYNGKHSIREKLVVVEPLPRSSHGNNCILILQDDLTKFSLKLEYGSIIWDPTAATHSSMLEHVQLKFLNIISYKLKLNCPPPAITNPS